MKTDYRSIALYIMAISIALLAFLFIAIGAGYAQEPTRCATIKVNYPSMPYAERITVDDGLSVTWVGHYLWFQNTAEQPTSTAHLESLDMKPYSGTTITHCVGDTTWDTTTDPTTAPTSSTANDTASTPVPSAGLQVPTQLITSPRWHTVD